MFVRIERLLSLEYWLLGRRARSRINIECSPARTLPKLCYLERICTFVAKCAILAYSGESINMQFPVLDLSKTSRVGVMNRMK